MRFLSLPTSCFAGYTLLTARGSGRGQKATYWLPSWAGKAYRYYSCDGLLTKCRSLNLCPDTRHQAKADVREVAMAALTYPESRRNALLSRALGVQHEAGRSVMKRNATGGVASPPGRVQNLLRCLMVLTHGLRPSKFPHRSVTAMDPHVAQYSRTTCGGIGLEGCLS